MHVEQRAKTRTLLENRGITRALFTHPDSVTWLTGFSNPVQTGPSPFSAGPPLLWFDKGHYALIIQEEVAGAYIAADDPDFSLHSYTGYTLDHGFVAENNLHQALESVTGSTGSGPIGIEKSSTPLNIVEFFQRHTADWVQIDRILEPFRMIKTEMEIKHLRESFSLTDVGHAAARSAIRPGMREIDLWTEIHSAIDREVGRRVPLGNDCVVGTRQNNIGGWPETEFLEEGDTIVVDLGVRLNGYWSDSCATYFAGQPGEKAIRVHSTVLGALEFAISLIRPGIAAGEIDRQVRRFIENAGYPVYPHHTGHGIGVSPHEAPRLVPGNPLVLDAGMVLMLEPGIYFPGELGVRLEDAVLVTDTGAEIMTRHEKRV